MQIETILVTILGSGALSAIISSAMTWRTNRRVELLKSHLERGLYVTKAHYDLELESFKKIWAALNDLRLKVRAFLGPDRFKISTPEGEIGNWYTNAYPRVIQDFFAAHDNVVRAVTETAPFYPAPVKKAAERTFEIDLKIINRIGLLDDTMMSEPWFIEMRDYSQSIYQQVAEVEQLIRQRLDSLRVIS